jgi:flagellar basal-body rod modification protein FlgD
MTSLAIPSSTTAAATSASTTAANAGTSSAGSGSAASLSQSDFLQLLTAQMKYQTPTNPADPTALASEFAQISTVDGIDKLNSTVSNLANGDAASSISQAAGLVGKQVAVAGNTITADASGAATGVFDLQTGAQNVSVSILSPSGAVAGTMNLGALPAGQSSFTWPNGTPGSQYSYQVTATSPAGTAVPVNTYSVYTVEGVNVSGTSQTLNVLGTSQVIPVSAIQTVIGGSAS